MNKIFTIFTLTFFSLLFTSSIFSQVIFTEDFESGTADPSWAVFYTNPETSEPEDSVIAVPMSQVPQALPTGGEYVGWLQDIDASYTGSAVAINGDVNLYNYSIEADVYCYVSHPDGSAYTGLVVYADTSRHDFYKMRADFDVSDRINFSGLRSDTITFQPLYNHNFTGAQNPGLFPTSDGWHKMKIEVRSLSADSTGFWCYFDNTLLNGCPIYDTTSNRNLYGSFGLYTFQMDDDGIPGYFDNIVVTSLLSAVDENGINIPDGIYLEQNYPNPFNPETQIEYQLASSGFVSLKIYDLLGCEIKSLVSQEQTTGSYKVTWDGTDKLGNKVPSGIYLYKLSSNNQFVSKKMILMK